MTGRILHPKKRADASTLFRCRPKASTAIDYFLSKSSGCIKTRPPVETTRSRPPNLAKYSFHHGRKERDGRPEEQPPLRRTQARRLAASMPLIHASILFVPQKVNPIQGRKHPSMQPLSWTHALASLIELDYPTRYGPITSNISPTLVAGFCADGLTLHSPLWCTMRRPARCNASPRLPSTAPYTPSKFLRYSMPKSLDIA